MAAEWTARNGASMSHKQLKPMLAAFLLILCLALSLAGCADTSNQKADAQTDAGTQAPATSEDEAQADTGTQAPATGEDGTDTDAGTQTPAGDEAATRTITFPKSRFEDDESDAEIRAYLEDLGYDGITKNDDGSWTVTMPAEVYDAYIAALDEGLEETVNALKDADSWPNIASVEHNEDYSEITITLKTDSMTLTDSFAPMTVGIPICTLQEASGGVAGCHIVILGADGSQLKEANYPEAVEDTISTFMNW